MKILVIPDTQVRPGVRTDHLEWIGRYAAAKEPDVIVQLGDFWDMPSLSSYDRGTGSAEGRRVAADIGAGNRGLAILTEYARAKKGYDPRLVLLRGNHEQRIERYVNANPELSGTVGYHQFADRDLGWEPKPFLEPVTIAGVTFCHYFPRSSDGNISQTKRGAPSARAQILREMRSSIAGHKQGLDVAIHHTGSRTIRGVIAGSCLAPHHRVLTADLRYVPLGSVTAGEKLVSFDEDSYTDGVRSRRYRTGTVQAVSPDIDDLFDVTLSTGKVFRVTADHLWLVRQASGARWLRTDQMCTLEARGNACTHVPQLLDEWDEAASYSAGWLAGMYDGEGCLYTRETSGGIVVQLSISQKAGPAHDRIVAMLKEVVGVTSYSEHVQNRVHAIRIQGGRTQIAKVLGMLRPSRLLSKFTPAHLGRLNVTDSRQHGVISVKPAGRGEIVRIAIDTKTMVVEGYGHHNCYLHQEEYLSPQGTNYWRGVLMLHEVKNGNFSLMEVTLDFLRKQYGKG